MSEQDKKEDDRRDAGPAAMALADASQPTALDKDVELRPPDTELYRAARAGGASAPGDGGVAPVGAATPVATDEQATPLFFPDEAKEFRARWDAIQVGFVDEPRRAVAQADSLVAGTMKRLAEIFAEERARLDSQWGHDETVSTENLRLALRRYRSFFGRLLSV